MHRKWKLLSRLRLSVTPWTIQFIEFSRPEYWSGSPFPSPGDLPNPGIEPRSPTLQADSLPAEPWVLGRLCRGYVQIQQHFMYRTWASVCVLVSEWELSWSNPHSPATYGYWTMTVRRKVSSFCFYVQPTICSSTRINIFLITEKIRKVSPF